MKIRSNNISVKEESEEFYWLPVPNDHSVIYYLTTTGHEYIKNDYFYRRKDLDIYMVNYVVDGEGVLIYGGKTHTLKKGCLSIIYLNDENVFYPVSDNLEIYFFHIMGAQINDIYRKITENSENVFRNFPEKTVVSAFENIKKELTETPDFFEISKILNAFLLDILKFSKAEQQVYPPFIFKTMVAIRGGKLNTVGEIASSVGYTPIYLERQFKKHTGESIKSALIKREIDRAKNMLIATDASVEDIAHHLGYSNSDGFIKLFKKMLGVTPHKFRMKNKYNR